MAELLAPEDYADWNEQMVRRYDPEVFYNHPNGVVRWVERNRIKAVLRALDYRPQHTLLDAGCGAGNLLDQLQGRELHGLDLSPSMVARARARLEQDATIVQGDAEHLPYPNAKFDRVVASSLLAHVLHPEAVVEELKRVTKPGGLIVISISDDAQIERGIRWARALGLDKLLFASKDASPAAPGGVYHVDYHLHRLSLKRLREIVGNKLVECQVACVPRVFPVHSIVLYER